MALQPDLLAILVCPVSKAPLALSHDGQHLVCRTSELVYRIIDDIPVMLADDALPLAEWEAGRRWPR